MSKAKSRKQQITQSKLPFKCSSHAIFVSKCLIFLVTIFPLKQIQIKPHSFLSFICFVIPFVPFHNLTSMCLYMCAFLYIVHFVSCSFSIRYASNAKFCCIVHNVANASNHRRFSLHTTIKWPSIINFNSLWCLCAVHLCVLFRFVSFCYHTFSMCCKFVLLVNNGYGHGHTFKSNSYRYNIHCYSVKRLIHYIFELYCWELIMIRQFSHMIQSEYYILISCVLYVFHIWNIRKWSIPLALMAFAFDWNSSCDSHIGRLPFIYQQNNNQSTK